VSFLPDFTHRRPLALEEALNLVSADDMPYAGGTELLLAMKAGLLRPNSLVDLKHLPELREITVDGDDLIIGAAVTHQIVAGSHTVRDSVPILAEVAAQVGNPRVRSVGTLGGNLCFAEPRSDIATVLIALDAVVCLLSARGERELSVAEFIVGPYTTVREGDEILTAIRVQIVPGRLVVYEQFKTLERPTVGVAAVGLDDRSVRVVVGAVGSVVEQFEGPRHDIDPAQIAQHVEVIADLGGSERYKRHLTEVSIRRALERIEATR